MKTCTKCKVEKDEALFNRCKTSKNGVYHACKECRAEYASNNREKIYEYHAKYRKNNREKVNEHKAKYRKNNREKLNEHQAKYYADNISRLREKSRVRANKCTHDLANPYIVTVIRQGTTLKAKDIPIELIEAKRMQMMINRKLKEMRE